MKNFFQSERYTEFFTEKGEVWVFGDVPSNITENTPHQFVARDTNWGDGTEEVMELPITDGHGIRALTTGRAYVGTKWELLGTTAEEKIKQTGQFSFNFRPVELSV